MEDASHNARDDEAISARPRTITRAFPYLLLFAGTCSVIATIWLATTERIHVEQSNAIAQTSDRAEVAVRSYELNSP